MPSNDSSDAASARTDKERKAQEAARARELKAAYNYSCLIAQQIRRGEVPAEHREDASALVNFTLQAKLTHDREQRQRKALAARERSARER